MQIVRRRRVDTGANEIATHAVVHSHGGVTAIVSVIALVFSAFSLGNVLKRADLTAYVTGGHVRA
jgi:hypothetical protein